MSMNPSTETARSSHHQHHLRHQQQLQQQQQHYAGGTNRHLADGIGAGLGSNHRSSFAQQRQAQAAMVPGVTQPTVGNESQSPASSTATACGTTSSASSSSNGSSGSNIFGRFVKKVVSSKTKTFASSPLTKTASSTGSDAAATVSKPKMLRTKVAKEPKVPVGVSLHVQTSNLPSGPVITGAVTKSPVAVSHCSPSKQLLNSLFSVSEPVKNLPNVSPSPAMVLNNLKAPLSGGGVNNGSGGDVRDGEKVADNNNDNSSSTCGPFANRGGERLRQSSLSHDSQLGTTETATLDTETTTTEANKTEVGRSALDTVRGRPANVATVTQHNGKLCQPVGAIRRSVLTSDTQDSLSQAESLQQSTNGDKVTTTATTTRNSQSANVTGVVSSNSNSASSQVCPVSGARLPFDSSPTDRTPQPPTTAPLNKLNNILNNGHIVNDLNNHTHHEDVPLDKLLYKPKMRRSISKDSIDEKFWNSINETQQLQDYLKNTSSMLKNLNMMNQVRGANFKNAHNHQFNNFHQYILQLQREKQDLQSQLIELVQNADLKRHEIEKLQKDLKQVKEKYYIHKQQVEEELAKSKDDVKIEDDKSVEYDDTQAGPSGFCNTGYEWDKRSSSSISELSVANLQDRINQMEETHYSTSEELQATVQELEDLRDQVTHLENNNEQLELDKNFLLGTLCEQTKKLENCLVKIDRMQKLLFSQYSATTEAGDEQGEAGTSRFSSTDREESLVELLRTIENEKNEILQKKNDLMLDYEDLRAKFEQERMELFEAKLKNIEQFQRMNEEDDDVESEIFVFRRPLHSARSLPDFQHPPGANSTSFHSLDDLDRSTETDDSVLVERLQFIVRQLQDQVAMKDVELKKIKEANILLESNHKDALQKSDHLIKTLENRNKELNELNDDLNHQLKSSHEAKMESEIRAQKNLDEKREIRTLLEDKDKRIDDLESKLQVKCRELTELADKITVERSEWGQFQNDLLTTVRVANEFKQETLTDCKKLQIERHQLEERLIATEQEVQRIKSENEKLQVALRSAAVAAAVSGDTNNSVTTSSVVSNTIKLPSAASSDQIGGSAGVTNSPSKPSNLLIQKLKDFENVPESATPANTPTSPRLTYSIRQNNNKISVRSLVESIESKKSSGSTSPTNSACSTPSLCLRSNSVPVTTNEIISRSTQNGSAPATKTSTPNSNSVAIVAPTILKESPKPAESKPAIRADILSNKIRSTLSELSDKKDPLSALVRGGGSKRNALLKWCKTKTTDYPGIDITNFSSSWNDGLAFCAILHTYLKEKIPYETLNADDKHRNFSIAFKAAESVGISTTLELNEVISQERPDWHKIMAYVTSIYTHFET